MKTRRGIIHIIIPAFILLILIGAYGLWYINSGSKLNNYTYVIGKVIFISESDTTTKVTFDSSGTVMADPSSVLTFLGTNLGFQVGHMYAIRYTTTALNRYNPFSFTVVCRISSITG
jgi:hypothetical protein